MPRDERAWRRRGRRGRAGVFPLGSTRGRGGILPLNRPGGSFMSGRPAGGGANALLQELDKQIPALLEQPSVKAQLQEFRTSASACSGVMFLGR